MDSSKNLDLEIRAHLDRYVGRHETLDEFRSWFIPATWDVHLANNPQAEQLTNRVAHFLGEYVSGNITEATLRNRLRPQVSTYVIEYTSAPRPILRTALSGAILGSGLTHAA